MVESVLELKDITRNYTQGGDTLSVLRGVDVCLQAGEAVALMAPSGAGKSTLLHIAGLLDTPSAGEVCIVGTSYAKASDAERTQARLMHIGFVYQAHHLLPEFSALENVMLPMQLAGIAPSARRERAEYLLTQLGLSSRLYHRPAKLSGGECQRVAVARALANEPCLVLADEPTGNLDTASAEATFGLLLALTRDAGAALLMATHNPELAARMDRVLILQDGRIS